MARFCNARGFGVHIFIGFITKVANTDVPGLVTEIGRGQREMGGGIARIFCFDIVDDKGDSHVTGSA